MKWPFLTVCLIIGLQGLSSPAYASEDSLVVVELFTSQGCPACPAADKVLTELAKEPNTIALSWAVNYWDYLGWADANAKPEYTIRQEAYNAAFKKKGVYTPQMIVNGRKQMIGSRVWDIREAITHYRQNEAPLTKVTMGYKSGTLNVAVRASTQKAFSLPSNVYLVWYELEQTVNVSMGDNHGQTLTYSNIVKGISKIGELTTHGVDLDVDISRLLKRNIKGFAVLVQDAPGTPIVGAGTLTITAP